MAYLGKESKLNGLPIHFFQTGLEKKATQLLGFGDDIQRRERWVVPGPRRKKNDKEVVSDAQRWGFQRRLRRAL